MAPEVREAVALEPDVVRVVFADGQTRDVDIEPLLDGPIFEPLRDRRDFAAASVDPVHGAVCWPNGADLDSDVIYGAAPAANEPAARITIPQIA